MGSGPILGLAPAPEFTFLIFATPVTNYYKVSWRVIEITVIYIAFVAKEKFIIEIKPTKTVMCLLYNKQSLIR